jgi:ABC-type nitrate/sulfonate/bicarbonate transport system ATPase subunit
MNNHSLKANMIGPTKRQFNWRRISANLALSINLDRILKHPKTAAVAFLLATLGLSQPAS